jgi:hypothetical protein
MYYVKAVAEHGTLPVMGILLIEDEHELRDVKAALETLRDAALEMGHDPNYKGDRFALSNKVKTLTRVARQMEQED